MKNFQEKCSDFRQEYDAFINSCDALEMDGKWDKDQFGEMEAYYSSDLINVALRLMIADRKMTQEEVDIINLQFGFKYTAEELEEVYRECGKRIKESFEESVRNSFLMARMINETFAQNYIRLVHQISDIMIESDYHMWPEETHLAMRLRHIK